MNSRPKMPWSPGDKILILGLALVVPLILGLFLWFRSLDQNPTITIPTPTMPMPNARDYFIAAGEAIVDSGKIGFAVSPWDPSTKPSGDQHFYTLADKEKLVAENAGAIQTLHTGFQYPYQAPPQAMLFSPSENNYEKMRGLARLLILQADVASGRGDFGIAMSASLDAIQLGEELPHGGPLIGMLVGVACQAPGRKQAWKFADRLDTAQTKIAARRLQTIRKSHVPFADTLQEEEWGTQAGLLEKMRQREWPANIGTFTGDESNILPTQMLLIRCRLAGKRGIMASYTRYMDQSIANARQPYATHTLPPTLPTDPVNQFLMPGFAGIHLFEVKADTQNGLLLMTLALRAYRLEHGAYPPTLGALVPHYLQAIPTDPFALSGPLRYKPVGAKYLLYSVGPDGKDDGGRAIFDLTKPAPGPYASSDARRYVQENSLGDIVAGVNTN